MAETNQVDKLRLPNLTFLGSFFILCDATVLSHLCIPISMETELTEVREGEMQLTKLTSNC